MRVESKWALNILNRGTGRTLLHSVINNSKSPLVLLIICVVKSRFIFTDLKVSTRSTCKTSGIFARCYCTDTYLIEKTA